MKIQNKNFRAAAASVAAVLTLAALEPVAEGVVEAAGFGLYTLRALLDGRGAELIELANTNLVR